MSIMKLTNISPVSRISISDIPKRDGEVKRFKYIKGVTEPPQGRRVN